MKKLSLLIALGIACSIAIAKPTVNVSQFETYSQQMQDMSAKYISEKKFDNANKTIEAWLNSYNLLSDKEKASYAPVYATIMYNKACALTQKNEMIITNDLFSVFYFYVTHLCRSICQRH